MMDCLRGLVEEELSSPVDPRVEAMAEAIAQQHGAASRAVLFYGSCLRERQLDGLMLDFYLIVSDYRLAFDRRWQAIANRLVPPNVYYFEYGGLRAKYAVLSETDFRRLCGPRTHSVSVWARFAQPSRLAWAADKAANDEIVASVALAAPTLLASAMPVLKGDDPLDLWRGAFALTYSAELRAERKERSASVVDLDPQRYLRFTEPALKAIPKLGPRAWCSWRRRRLEGKALSVVRLAKASATFAGGVDYIAWKINRHAGTRIVIKPWQRRWPLLAAVSLLPRLLRSGAVR